MREYASTEWGALVSQEALVLLAEVGAETAAVLIDSSYVSVQH